MRQEWALLGARVDTLPEPARDLARAGLRKVVEFQDLRYGAEYLDRLEDVARKDRAPFDFTREAAKYIANAMAYDDVIRVADLKTRGKRFDRIQAEMGVKGDKLLHLTEFMHPRAEEIAGMLPRGLGARISADAAWMARLDRWFSKGRRLRTDGLVAFTMLYVLGGLKGWRRKTLRHAQEVEHLENWLARATGLFRDPCAGAVKV